jgi:hypothetical protein
MNAIRQWVVVLASAAKRPTTQPDQNTRDEDCHPANDDGVEREPDEGHFSRQPCLLSVATQALRPLHSFRPRLSAMTALLPECP